MPTLAAGPFCSVSSPTVLLSMYHSAVDHRLISIGKDSAGHSSSVTAEVHNVGSVPIALMVSKPALSFGLSITALAPLSSPRAVFCLRFKFLARPEPKRGCFFFSFYVSHLWPISIDYPEDGSIFPSGNHAAYFPMARRGGHSWTIDVTFPDKAAPIHSIRRASG